MVFSDLRKKSVHPLSPKYSYTAVNKKRTSVNKKNTNTKVCEKRVTWTH